VLKRVLLALLVAVPVIGLSILLNRVETEHDRLTERAARAMIALDATYEAALILDTQREHLVATAYLPLDRHAIRTWGAEFQRHLSNPALAATPTDRRLQRSIQAAASSFTAELTSLPPHPSRDRVLALREQGDNLAQELALLRSRHAVNLNALLTSESQQRRLSLLVIVVSNGVIVLFLVVGYILLSRLAAWQARAQALEATEQLRREFVSFAAHELRNPASAIKMGAYLLGQPDLSPEQRAEVGLALGRNADALSRVVLNLLNIGRVEAGRLRLQLQPVSLPELAQELLSELEPYYPGLPGRLQQQLPAATVQADPELLKLVLSNLLDNAVKYSPPQAPILLQGEVSGGMVVVHVRDRGVGIPPDQLPHIFDKYETGGEAPYTRRPGVGLGLYMARLLVEAHGGSIWAESLPGAGTTISFALPLAGPPARPRR